MGTRADKAEVRERASKGSTVAAYDLGYDDAVKAVAERLRAREATGMRFLGTSAADFVEAEFPPMPNAGASPPVTEPPNREDR